MPNSVRLHSQKRLAALFVSSFVVGSLLFLTICRTIVENDIIRLHTHFTDNTLAYTALLSQMDFDENLAVSQRMFDLHQGNPFIGDVVAEFEDSKDSMVIYDSGYLYGNVINTVAEYISHDQDLIDVAGTTWTANHMLSTPELRAATITFSSPLKDLIALSIKNHLPLFYILGASLYLAMFVTLFYINHLITVSYTFNHIFSNAKYRLKANELFTDHGEKAFMLLHKQQDKQHCDAIKYKGELEEVREKSSNKIHELNALLEDMAKQKANTIERSITTWKSAQNDIHSIITKSNAIFEMHPDANVKVVKINEICNRLLDKTNQLRDEIRIEKLSDLDPIDFFTVLETIYDNSKAIGQENGVEVSIHIDKNIPTSIAIDDSTFINAVLDIVTDLSEHSVPSKLTIQAQDKDRAMSARFSLMENAHISLDIPTSQNVRFKRFDSEIEIIADIIAFEKQSVKHRHCTMMSNNITSPLYYREGDTELKSQLSIFEFIGLTITPFTPDSMPGILFTSEKDFKRLEQNEEYASCLITKLSDTANEAAVVTTNHNKQLILSSKDSMHNIIEILSRASIYLQGNLLSHHIVKGNDSEGHALLNRFHLDFGIHKEKTITDCWFVSDELDDDLNDLLSEFELSLSFLDNEFALKKCAKTMANGEINPFIIASESFLNLNKDLSTKLEQFVEKFELKVLLVRDGESHHSEFLSRTKMRGKVTILSRPYTSESLTRLLVGQGTLHKKVDLDNHY